MSVALPVRRGCGTRIEGGIYWTLGLGPNGKPVEDFLIDPPQAIPFPVSALGVHLIDMYDPDQQKTVTHVIDRIGMEHYPNVADFVEEVRRFGLSRRIAKTVDFSKLTSDSRILLVHDRASVENYGEYVKYGSLTPNGEPPDLFPCPQNKEDDGHPYQPMVGACAGFWWDDLDPITGEGDGGRLIVRKMPSFGYVASLRHPAIKPKYQAAFFASFPCSRLEVVSGEGFEEAFSTALNAELPVSEVEM